MKHNKLMNLTNQLKNYRIASTLKKPCVLLDLSFCSFLPPQVTTVIISLLFKKQ